MLKNFWEHSKPIIIFLLGLGIGSGGIFQYLHYTTEREKNKIEKLKVAIELHRKISEDFSELVGRVQESEKINSEIANLQSRPDSEIKLQEIQRQAARLWTVEQELMDGIIMLEGKAAELENRPPRKIIFTIAPPPPPIGMKLVP